MIARLDICIVVLVTSNGDVKKDSRIGEIYLNESTNK